MGDVFKALADPTRRKLLDELAEREDRRYSSSAPGWTGTASARMTRQAISQHLDVLEAPGSSRAGARGVTSFTPRYRAARALIATAGSSRHRRRSMKINLASVFVDDQDKALRFYTEVLGFMKKTEVPLGEDRWLTVVSAGGSRRRRVGARTGRAPRGQAVQGRAGRGRDPVHVVRGRRRPAEYDRLAALGVQFTQAPPDGPGHDRRPRRHLRQPHPDRRRDQVRLCQPVGRPSTAICAFR